MSKILSDLSKILTDSSIKRTFCHTMTVKTNKMSQKTVWHHKCLINCK